MKKINLFVLLTIISIVLFSCKKEITLEAKNYDKINQLTWLLGEWKNTTTESDFTEKWTQKTDSSYTGKSYVLVGKDTVFNENVVLEQRNDSLFYNVSVKNEVTSETISFYMTKSDNKQLIFENPKHDFPTKIVYNKISKDSIFAEIFGKQDGKEVKEVFPMKRKI